jgi:hypothetical protein
MDFGQLSRRHEGFEESDLPFQVDVLDWELLSETFQGLIEKQYRSSRRRISQVKTARPQSRFGAQRAPLV